MKTHPVLLSFALILLLGLAALTAGRAAVEPSAGAYAYATIRYDDGMGHPNIHVVRPDGKVEFFAVRLAREKAPEGSDPRAYFMNLVMNVLAKEGYEMAGVTDSQIVMKRPDRR